MAQPAVVLDDADIYLSFAAELADAARPVVLSYFRTPLDVVSKPDESPVTATGTSLSVIESFPSWP